MVIDGFSEDPSNIAAMAKLCQTKAPDLLKCKGFSRQLLLNGVVTGQCGKTFGIEEKGQITFYSEPRIK